MTNGCFKHFCLLLSILWTIDASGQEVSRSWSLTGYRGSILAHAEELEPFASHFTTGVELSYKQLNTTEKRWQACACFYSLNFGVSWMDFGNSEVLGQAFGAYMGLEPILWRKNRWRLSLDSRVGAVYLSRVYDQEDNPDNTFFSAPVSFLLQVAPVLGYQLTPQWELRGSLAYGHISNGGQRQPNRGMNFPQLGLGVAYRQAGEIEYSKYRSPERPQGVLWLTELGGTSRGRGSNRYPSISLSLDAYSYVSTINGLGGGTEWVYDPAAAAHHPWIGGLYISHQFLFGKLRFSQRMAWYLTKPELYKRGENFYQRYLLFYKVWQNLYLGISLKAHGHVAENMDLRISWQW